MAIKLMAVAKVEYFFEMAIISQLFSEKKYLTPSHFLPLPPAQFILHINGRSKVIRILLSREFEIGKDIGFSFDLVKVGVKSG